MRCRLGFRALGCLAQRPGGRLYSAESVRVTAKAALELERLRSEPGGGWVRLRVEPGGCEGFQYVFEIASKAEPGEDEEVDVGHGARMLLDTAGKHLLSGSVVDFEETAMRTGFHVLQNPLSTGSCGCRSSFAIDEKLFLQKEKSSSTSAMK